MSQIYFTGLAEPDVEPNTIPYAAMSLILQTSHVENCRFWRTDPKAEYGPFNAISSHRLNFVKKQNHTGIIFCG